MHGKCVGSLFEFSFSPPIQKTFFSNFTSTRQSNDSMHMHMQIILSGEFIAQRLISLCRDKRQALRNVICDRNDKT